MFFENVAGMLVESFLLPILNFIFEIFSIFLVLNTDLRIDCAIL